MNEIKLIVRPFEMGTEKEAALKPLEEAAEVYAAWQKIDECGIPEQCRYCDLHNTCEAIFALADEIADTIQASCNLAVRYSIDLQAAMERCEKRNRERGRYEDEDAKSCGGNDCDCGGGCWAVPDGDDAPKSPEEMSAEELIETLYLANGYRGNGDGYCEDGSCTKTLGVDWCGIYHTCRICRKHLLDLLETAYKQEKEGLRCEEFYLAEECTKRDKEIEVLKREIADLIHERDGLRRRLKELSEAGITELHRLLRETLGEAKNVTDNARVYIENQRGSKDDHCGSRGSDRRNHGGVCGVERVGEHILPAEPPAQEMSEREKVCERLRELDFTQKNLYLSDIGCAVLGRDPSSWWSDESRAALRDKLIELLNNGE